MRSAGYTLIELLVVISIIGILSVVGFVNIKDFSSAQALKKAAGDVQSFLRLAQSNATSSAFCNKVGVVDVYGVSWKVTFSPSDVVITCGSNPSYKTLKLQTGITIKDPPSPVVYSVLKGIPDSGVTIILTNDKVPPETKTVILTSGGAINVQ